MSWSLQPDGELSYWEKLGPSFSFHPLHSVAFSGILCARREREWWLSSLSESHFICCLNVLRGGLKNIGLII